MKPSNVEVKCPTCGERLDAHLETRTKTHTDPVVRDVTICAYCATICRFVTQDDTLVLEAVKIDDPALNNERVLAATLIVRERIRARRQAIERVDRL